MNVARSLLVTLIALAVLIAGAAVALFTLDLGFLGGALTAWASRELGRPVAIDGPLSIRAGRTLRLTASGVHVAAVAAEGGGDIFAAARISLEVDAWSLVNHPVLVRRIEVDGLDLRLERRADGANWDSGRDGGEPFSWPESLPFIIERVSLPGARIHYAGPRLARPLELKFQQLEQEHMGDGMLRLAGQGMANDVPVDLKLLAGPVAALRRGRDFSVAVDGDVGELALDARLQMDDIAKPVDTTLAVRLRGPDATYLASQFGLENLGAGPLVLDAAVRPAADGQGVQGDVAGTLGQFRIKASGDLADPTSFGRLHLDLDVAGPDLPFAGDLVGVRQLPGGPFELNLVVDRDGEALRVQTASLALPDTRGDLQGTLERLGTLAGADLRFRLKGENLARLRDLLSLPAGLAGPFEASGRIHGDDGSEAELQATTTVGNLKLSGTLGDDPDLYGSRVRFETAGRDLARVGALAGLAGLPAVAYTASGDLQWTQDGAMLRKGTLQAGRDRVGLDGRIGRDPLGVGTAFTWTARGPDLARFAAIFGVSGAPAVAFDLGGRLQRQKRATQLSGVAGTVAGARLQLSGSVGDQPLSGTRLKVSLAGPRLEAFAALAPGVGLPPGQFSIDGGVALMPGHVELDDLAIEVAGAEGSLDADMTLPLGAVAGRFAIEARGPDLGRFTSRSGQGLGAFRLRLSARAKGGTWAVDTAELSTGIGRVQAAGQLDWAPDFSATDLRFDADVGDLAAVGRVFGLQLPKLPLVLKAELTGTPTAFRLAQASGTLGQSDFDGHMQLDMSGRPQLSLALRSRLLDLRPWLDGAAGPSAPPAATAGQSAAGGRSGNWVIPDTPLPQLGLRRMDVALDIRATRALTGKFALDDLHVGASLAGGALTIRSLDMKALPDGHLVFEGQVTESDDGLAVSIAGQGRQVALMRLEDTPAERARRPRADMEVKLRGAGRTWRQLAASLDGELSVRGGPGTIPRTSLDNLLGQMWRDVVAAVIKGGRGPQSTEVRCVAAFLAVTQGVVQTRPAIVMQTPAVTLFAHGSADLNTEKLDVYLRTTPTNRISISLGEIANPYIKIAGTLSGPRVAVDPAGALFNGTAAVATGGLSILARGLWDRMFTASDPCAEAAAQAARLQGKAASRTRR